MNLLHALFTRNLLMSGVAIVRYIPRTFRVKQVDGNLFFTEEMIHMHCSPAKLRLGCVLEFLGSRGGNGRGGRIRASAPVTNTFINPPSHQAAEN